MKSLLSKMNRLCILTSALFISNANCTSTNKAPDSKNLSSKNLDNKNLNCEIIDHTKGPELKDTAKWQNAFLHQLCIRNAQEAWGMFNQGGITGAGDFGLVMVIAEYSEDDHKTTHDKILHVKPGAEKIEADQTLHNQNEFTGQVQKFTPHMKNIWDNGFDMFEHEYIHAQKSGNTITIQQRTHWRCAEHNSKEKDACKANHDMAELFRSLVRPKAKR